MDRSRDFARDEGEDRRKSARYRFTGAVQFQWCGRDGQWHDGRRVTRDIGKGGLFIESDSIPPIASALKIVVTLPALSQADPTPQISGVGFVCRLKQEPYQTRGFGVSAVFHTEATDIREITKEKATMLPELLQRRLGTATSWVRFQAAGFFPYTSA